MSDEVGDALAELARAHGVATSYADHLDRPREVAAGSVVAVLAAMGVPAGSPGEVATSLAAARDRPWRRPLPPTVAARHGVATTLTLHLPSDLVAGCLLELEDGSTQELRTGEVVAERTLDGRGLTARELHLPDDLPTGWHRLVPVEGDASVLLVAPTVVPLPPALERTWGWAVQLYAVHSAGSWGHGDYVDLAGLARWSGGLGAGALLANPLHAVAPVAPVQPSPYYPTSRRFRSPLYLRLEATEAYLEADAATRAAVDALHPGVPQEPIDRDGVWAAKQEGLSLLFRSAGERDGLTRLAAFRREQGEGLERFAVFCALAETHGSDLRTWPPELRDPASEEVRRVAAGLTERVTFHCWLQQLCDLQLAGAAAAAAEAGMSVGVVHDLAVGVDPGGADAWALQDTLALGVTVGAPPDGFNPLGQDWQLPPWQPARLAEAGYGPYVDMLRGVLRHSGGIRIDHVMGLFRLWWVPQGMGSAQGTYVSYDAEVLLSVLALEAERAGVLVVGEDLGTVSPETGATLAERGMVGTSVLFFETEAEPGPDGDPEFAPLAGWRERTVATVTTHDLPTAVSWLRDDHVDLRDRLGVLGAEPDDERRRTRLERAALARRLRRDGVPGADALPLDGSPPADLPAAVLALHAALVRTPARVVLAALGDAAGDPRQPNVPGTVDEYPNWRLPVADPGGRPVSWEDLAADAQVLAMAAVLDAGTATRDRGAGATVG